ncbi:hypothetical protein [Caballeronia sp. 15711]|uniref:hypothetical protein n=1 Tax=Caballeronia sp. 15711 TaxID=3391029 RepID=UPI0039E5CE6C
MMNNRKILMIIGALLIGAAGATYLVFLQADRRAMAEVSAAMDQSARPPVADPVAGDHVTEGSFGQTQPSGAITQSTGIVQPPAPSGPAVAPVPKTAALASSPATAQVTGQPKPEAQAKKAPSTAVASVNVQDSGAPKVVSAQRGQRGRDGLDRRATAAQGATPETDELVRESAKLDPSLPPPNMSAARAATDQRSSKPGSGANPVAAAMTDQFVRNSARIDPSPAAPK